jgi:hypothetical protein
MMMKTRMTKMRLEKSGLYFQLLYLDLCLNNVIFRRKRKRLEIIRLMMSRLNKITRSSPFRMIRPLFDLLPEPKQPLILLGL